MNRYFSLKLLAVALGALLAGITVPAQAQLESPLPSTVVRLSGAARFSTDAGKSWRPLKLGTVIASGSWVQTAAKSDLDLLLGEQVKPSKTETFYNPEVRPAHLVSLSANTLVKLDKVTSKAVAGAPEPTIEIALELRQGVVIGNVKKLSGASKYEMTFPNGVAGIREAIYKVNSVGRLGVLRGKAYVALTSDGSVKEVGEAQEIDARTGVVSAAPATPAPDPVVPAKPSGEPSTTPAKPDRDTALPPLVPPHSGVRRAGT